MKGLYYLGDYEIAPVEININDNHYTLDSDESVNGFYINVESIYFRPNQIYQFNCIDREVNVLEEALEYYGFEFNPSAVDRVMIVGSMLISCLFLKNHPNVYYIQVIEKNDYDDPKMIANFNE